MSTFDAGEHAKEMADYKQITSFIKKWEGGLSKAKTDTASAYPVPDGSGYHTNKGVTWKTFITLAPKLGYTATPKLFYDMPDDVWGKIFKSSYWDVVRGDEIKSQAIADTLVDFAWGAGPARAVTELQRFLKVRVSGHLDDATLRALNQADEQSVHAGFSAYKQNWYLSLPNQQANYAGWKRRLTDLYNVTIKKLGTGGTIATLVLITAAGLGLLYLITNNK